MYESERCANREAFSAPLAFTHFFLPSFFHLPFLVLRPFYIKTALHKTQDTERENWTSTVEYEENNRLWLVSDRVLWRFVPFLYPTNYVDAAQRSLYVRRRTQNAEFDRTQSSVKGIIDCDWSCVLHFASSDAGGRTQVTENWPITARREGNNQL